MTYVKNKFKNIVDKINNEVPFNPELCIILGSGLGDFAERLDLIKSIPTKNISGYPLSTVQGHSGYLHFAKYKAKKLFIVQGRIHLYEGYSLPESVLPVLIASATGCSSILLTNAAGGINKNFCPGDLMLSTKVNGINIKKELAEIIHKTDNNEVHIGYPSRKMNLLIKKAAESEKILLREGVYWYTKGPSYETPSEIRMISKFGGDAVGMSTVHEFIYAESLNLNVASISCITNYAAGLSSHKLTHKEVIETANYAKKNFNRLVRKTIELL